MTFALHLVDQWMVSRHRNCKQNTTPRQKSVHTSCIKSAKSCKMIHKEARCDKTISWRLFMKSYGAGRRRNTLHMFNKTAAPMIIFAVGQVMRVTNCLNNTSVWSVHHATPLIGVVHLRDPGQSIFDSLFRANCFDFFFRLFLCGVHLLESRF